MTDVSTDPLLQRRRRLLYRATHRGTYENDLMIGGFARKYIGAMDGAALDAFEAVMEHPDTELADWLTGRKPIPVAADSAMLRTMRGEAAEIAQGEFGAKRGR